MSAHDFDEYARTEQKGWRAEEIGDAQERMGNIDVNGCCSVHLSDIPVKETIAIGSTACKTWMA